MAGRDIGCKEDAPSNCPIKVGETTIKYRDGIPKLHVGKLGFDEHGQVVGRIDCDGAFVVAWGGLTAFIAEPCSRCVLCTE